MADSKSLLLATHDYGMGAIWLAFMARAPNEVKSLYPEMEVVAERPDWMDDETFDSIVAVGVWDIDEPPTGVLAEYVRARNSASTPKNRS